MKSNRGEAGDAQPLKAGAQVKLLIGERTNLGFKVLINGVTEGLIYHTEIFEAVNEGDERKGFIKKLRDDGKVDVSLQKQGYGHITDSKEQILIKLRENKGVLPVGDRSEPEEIYSLFGISKKAFKRIVGTLYKEQRVVISDHELRLMDTRGE